MTPAERTAFHEMRELPKELDSDDWIMLDDVLNGSIPLDISHEGRELDGLRDEFRKTCALLLWLTKRGIQPADAYMDWGLQYADRDKPLPDPEPSPNDGAWPVCIINLFSECGYIGYFSFIPILHSDAKTTLASALVHQDVMPCSPLVPSITIMIDVLELYRVVNLCSPHLSIQAFIKTLCDLHGDDTPGPSSEYIDSRIIDDDFYLMPEYVNEWANEAFEDLMATTGQDNDDYNPCTDRWKNMKEDITRKMWAIFDETSIFLALCHHRFSLVITDMVQSGKLAKYLLACVSKILDVFGPDVRGGFDIGCRFKTTLAKSPLRPRAHKLNYTSLGMGLKDLEGCERCFSKSNALASSLRYASIFHHKQAISTYFKHNDNMEVYQNLRPTALAQAMTDLRIMDAKVFDKWREEERVYLKGLQKEPITETLKMEYYQKLVNLCASEHDLEAARVVWIQLTPKSLSSGSRDITKSLETARRHTLERTKKT
ncbi:hypothetical protein PILCRDRAFT_11120 [Piloderma croceum F 1598]|uniref:Uncharacterized protein n=1 Tax=Piloderma croceum (strain F 1598) TaxID=765440 RepID=A0A0C3FEJ8_PILCF|nr:hypothetical protein PILCRDRAFT_11120 [Piloderma croceum F 1598]